jgi:hypothetical protein
MRAGVLASAHWMVAAFRELEIAGRSLVFDLWEGASMCTFLKRLVSCTLVALVGLLPISAVRSQTPQPCAAVDLSITLTEPTSEHREMAVLVRAGDVLVFSVTGSFDINKGTLSYTVNGITENLSVSPGVRFDVVMNDGGTADVSFNFSLTQHDAQATLKVFCIPAFLPDSGPSVPTLESSTDRNPDGRLNWGICDQSVVVYPMEKPAGVAVYEIITDPSSAFGAVGQLAFFVELSDVQLILDGTPLDHHVLVKQAGRAALYVQKDTGFIQINIGQSGDTDFCTFEMDSLNPSYIAQIEPSRRVGSASAR